MMNGDRDITDLSDAELKAIWAQILRAISGLLPAQQAPFIQTEIMSRSSNKTADQAIELAKRTLWISLVALAVSIIPLLTDLIKWAHR